MRKCPVIMSLLNNSHRFFFFYKINVISSKVPWKITLSLNVYPACTFTMHFYLRILHKYKQSADSKQSHISNSIPSFFPKFFVYFYGSRFLFLLDVIIIDWLYSLLIDYLLTKYICKRFLKFYLFLKRLRIVLRSLQNFINYSYAASNVDIAI